VRGASWLIVRAAGWLDQKRTWRCDGGRQRRQERVHGRSSPASYRNIFIKKKYVNQVGKILVIYSKIDLVQSDNIHFLAQANVAASQSRHRDNVEDLKYSVQGISNIRPCM
jgi:hypothetical protein